MKEFSNEELGGLGFLQVPSKLVVNGNKQGFYILLFASLGFLILAVVMFILALLEKEYNPGFPNDGKTISAISIIATFLFLCMAPKRHRKWKNSIAQQQAVRNMASNYDGNLIVVSEQSVMVVSATLNSNVISDDLKAFDGKWLARLDVDKHQKIILAGIAWVDDELNALDLEMDEYRKTQGNLQEHVIEDKE